MSDQPVCDRSKESRLSPVALTVAERDALVAEVRRLRAEVAQLDAICWALNERTPTTVDAESGFRVGGRACEHPSLTGGRCDACGWTEAWQADRAANDVRYAANMTDALVSATGSSPVSSTTR